MLYMIIWFKDFMWLINTPELVTSEISYFYESCDFLKSLGGQQSNNPSWPTGILSLLIIYQGYLVTKKYYTVY